MQTTLLLCMSLISHPGCNCVVFLRCALPWCMLLRSGRLLESLLFFKCVLSRCVLSIPWHSCRVVALCCGKPGGMEGHPGGLGITPDNLLLTGYYQPMAPPASNTSTTPVLLYYKTRSSTTTALLLFLFSTAIINHNTPLPIQAPIFITSQAHTYSIPPSYQIRNLQKTILKI